MNTQSSFFGDRKLHYKMYKQGKHWLFAAICVVAFGAGVGSVAHVQAASSDPNAAVVAGAASKTPSAAPAVAKDADTTANAANSQPASTDGKQTPAEAPAAPKQDNSSTSTTTATTTAPANTPAPMTPQATTNQAPSTSGTKANAAAGTAATTTPSTDQTTSTTTSGTTGTSTQNATDPAYNTTLPDNLPAGVTASFSKDGTLNVVIPGGDTTIRAQVVAALAGKGYKNVNITDIDDDVDTITLTKDDVQQYFAFNGNPNAATYDKNTGIVTLTTDDNNQSGNITLDNQITTDHDFTLTGLINLGTKSQEQGGADGISFGFHTGGDTTAVGQNGGSLGFAGLSNAFGWKADTYWDAAGTNGDTGYFDADPARFDQNGKGVSFGALLHTQLVDGKEKAITTDSDNADDPSRAQQIPEPSGNFTDFVIHYDAASKQMTVTYGTKVWKQDVSQYVDSGDGKLNFFIAGSTGGSKNQQQFQFGTLAYTPSGVVNVSYVDDDNNGQEIPGTQASQLTGDVGTVDTTVGTMLSAEDATLTKAGYVNNGTVVATGTNYDLQNPSAGLKFAVLPGSIVVHYKHAINTENDTVKKVVQYQDDAGATIADPYTTTAAFTATTDAVTGTTTYSGNQTLGLQANPTLKGYTLKTSPAEATSDQTVTKADNGQTYTYTVVYTKNAPTITTSAVTKTVHYVDESGKKLANDFTDTVNFTSSQDAATDVITTTQDKKALGHQNDPVIKGYTVKTSPAEATSDQNVALGAQNEDYTVVYSKNPPTITTTAVTKTVHYVDASGKTLADDFTDTVTFTSSKDAVTDAVTTTQTKPALGHQNDPVIKGYTVKSSPAEATSDQNVALGAQDENYTVVYTKNPPIVLGKSTVTKTVHYIDETGDQVAPDFTTAVTFIKQQDPATDVISYVPATGKLGHQDNPDVPDYVVVISPAAATSDQSVQHDSDNQEYTVIYAKQTEQAVSRYTATKTVHYVDEAGNKLAPDFTQTVTFTKLQDPVTGAISYTQTAEIFGHQDNPSIPGYEVVTSPYAATRDQEAQYGDTNQEYNVVYAVPTSNVIVPPVQANKPGKPRKPTTANKPGKPTTPAKSTKPGKPTKPGNSSKPGKPSKPATPAKPAKPGKPETPTTGTGRDQTPPETPTTSRAYRPYRPYSPYYPSRLYRPYNPYQPGLPDTYGYIVYNRYGLPDTFAYFANGRWHYEYLAGHYGNNSGTQLNGAATQSSRLANGKSELPQTGDQTQPGLVAAGLALIMSALGLVGFRKREH